MYRVRQQDLPFKGSSHHFVGEDNGDVNVSVFLLSALLTHHPRKPLELEGGNTFTLTCVSPSFPATRLGSPCSPDRSRD